MNTQTEHNKSHANPYPRFFLMMAASFVIMYIVMYFNTYELDHVYFSMTRFYMTCLMIATMALIMLGFMLNMYKNKKNNFAIILGSIMLFFGSLFLVRTQSPIIGDVLWLRAMIPHHSIAILTSERADIKDPEVKKLANDIINAQKKEILEMKAMIKRLENDK
jgi:Na+/melibiose symporter-like transporter